MSLSPSDTISSRQTNRLTPSQRAAIEDVNPTMAIIAPAGSGKTTVLTQRVAKRIERKETPPNKVLALSFTRAAAYQIGERVTQLIDTTPITVGTFHSAALSTLKRFAEFTQQRLPAILPDPKKILSEILGQGSPSLKQALRYGATANQKAILTRSSTEISWAKSCYFDPSTYGDVAPSLRQVTQVQAEAISQLYRDYEIYKRRHGLLDVDDLVPQASMRVCQNEDFAKIERFLFRHFYVDEFQDANRSQIELLLAYLGDDNRDICVVGDPSQSIYGWNGAMESNMSDFIDTFPEAQIVILSENFRCVPEIVDVSSKIMPILADERVRYQVRPVRGTVPGAGVCFHQLKDDTDEALLCARVINSLHEQRVSYNAMAVLARTNVQLKVVDEIFRSLRIPTKSPGNANGLFSKYLKAMTKDWSSEELQRRIATLLALITESQGFHSGQWNHPPKGLLETILQLRRIQPEINVSDTIEVIDKVGDSISGNDAVTLTTFHGAKGLEWYHVQLIGVGRNKVPSPQTRRNEELLEEQRLLYVAMTRASDSLHISYTTQGVPGETPPWSSFFDLLENPPKDGLFNATSSIAPQKSQPPRESDPFGASERIYLETLSKIKSFRAQAAKRRGLLPEQLISNSAIRQLTRNFLCGSQTLIEDLSRSCHLSDATMSELLDFLANLGTHSENA